MSETMETDNPKRSTSIQAGNVDGSEAVIVGQGISQTNNTYTVNIHLNFPYLRYLDRVFAMVMAKILGIPWSDIDIDSEEVESVLVKLRLPENLARKLINILKQNPSVLSKWGADHIDVPELGEAFDLKAGEEGAAQTSGYDLSAEDLSAANFSGKLIERANFSEANLENANFRGSLLWACDFTGANLRNADLTGAKLNVDIFHFEALGSEAYGDEVLRIIKQQKDDVQLLSIAVMLASGLEFSRDLDRALVRAFALDYDFDRDRALVRALVRALELVRALALDYDFDLVHALDHALDLARVLDLGHGLGIILDRALALPLDLALASALPLDLALVRARDLSSEVKRSTAQTIGVPLEPLRSAGILHGATMPDGTRYNGRYNLPGDLAEAEKQGIPDTEDRMMADFYGVTLEEYREGQDRRAEGEYELEY